MVLRGSPCLIRWRSARAGPRFGRASGCIGRGGSSARCCRAAGVYPGPAARGRGVRLPRVHLGDAAPGAHLVDQDKDNLDEAVEYVQAQGETQE